MQRVLVAAVVAGLVACAPAPESGRPGEAVFMKPCPGFAETGKPALVYGAQCGELLLRENPDDPASAEIRVAILRLPAINPSPQKDPLFLIQGGPGGSSIDMAEQVLQTFADVRKNRDLVFVDQRGTGQSNPLNCAEQDEADMQLPEQEQAQRHFARMRACGEQYAAQVPFYTTPYAVADLDAVRAALGYEQINLWGGSYGSRVVLEYMRTRPERLRAVVMDGLAPVQIALPKYFARDASTALQALNKECTQQPQCAEQYGDLMQQADAILAYLRKQQARGSPVRVDYEHPRNQQREILWLTPRNFSSLVFMSLYSRDLTVLLPQALHKAAQQDYRLLASLHALASAQTAFIKVSEGMRYSVVCNEDARFITADDLAQGHLFLGMDMLYEFGEICAHWPKAEVPDRYFGPVVSDVPALLLSGGYDPVTPYTWAEQVAAHLSQASLLAAPGGNHIVSTDGCVPQIITQFIEQGGIGTMNTECITRIKPLPLVLGANEKKSSAGSSAGSSESVQP
ncbi:alpha/beta hydrolase [Cellvibrio japonicus]|nr:alpha/beta hydrolase [Cellvibrio japonicus]QEI11282.1 alpha/beta hydrolase [Cellvibrio japonicus]QEI14856.1 alpha/beta hydrolase [Cellvibrio japonicus]QEI18436.1 alpha/beta hydrolase [Cellvibrio japonicus]